MQAHSAQRAIVVSTENITMNLYGRSTRSTPSTYPSTYPQ